MEHLAELQRSGGLLLIQQRRSLRTLDALMAHNIQLRAQAKAHCRALRTLTCCIPMMRGGAETVVARTGDRCEVDGTYRAICACRTPQQMVSGMYFPRCFHCGKEVSWALQTPNRPAGGDSPATE